MAKKKGQNNLNQSFSNTDAPIESSAATPPAQPLNTADQAFQLATSNKKELDQIREDADHPQWAKDLIKSQASLNRVIKISLWLCLLILLILIFAFVLLSVFQINNLFSILEDIRNSENMEINADLLAQFNQLFFYCRNIANFLGSIIGAFGIVGLFMVIIIKVSEKFTASFKTKK